MGVNLKVGAFVGLNKVLKKYSVKELAQNFYPNRRDIQYVINSNLSGLKTEFPAVYKNIFSYNHKRDCRYPIEHAQDVIASWVMEDIFRKYYSSTGCKFVLSGSDKERRFRPDHEITNSSDFNVQLNGGLYSVELMADYTGYIKDNGVLHLRDNKYSNLKNKQAFLLVLSMVDKTFLLIDTTTLTNVKYLEHHKNFGDKPANEIRVNTDKFIPLDKIAIKNALVNMVNLRRENHNLWN